ncbi:MAG: hypothetical protein WCT36_00400 [Candidatus Gracilibacteria bacterium]|jgi:hypothetical protein
MKDQFKRLSFRVDASFLRNLTVAIGAVFMWRGIWVLADAYLFPGNPFVSSIICIVIGIFFLYLPDFDERHPHF